jgi:hypothetical protein
MDTARQTAGTHPRHVEAGRLSLWDFLTERMLAESCFCCGGSTERVPDGDGLTGFLCPLCGAEAFSGDVTAADESLHVLWAA